MTKICKGEVELVAQDILRNPHFYNALCKALERDNFAELEVGLLDCIEHSDCRFLFGDELPRKKELTMKPLPLLKRIKLAWMVIFRLKFTGAD